MELLLKISKCIVMHQLPAPLNQGQNSFDSWNLMIYFFYLTTLVARLSAKLFAELLLHQLWFILGLNRNRWIHKSPWASPPGPCTDLLGLLSAQCAKRYTLFLVKIKEWDVDCWQQFVLIVMSRWWTDWQTGLFLSLDEF